MFISLTTFTLCFPDLHHGHSHMVHSLICRCWWRDGCTSPFRGGIVYFFTTLNGICSWLCVDHAANGCVHLLRERLVPLYHRSEIDWVISICWFSRDAIEPITQESSNEESQLLEWGEGKHPTHRDKFQAEIAIQKLYFSLVILIFIHGYSLKTFKYSTSSKRLKKCNLISIS